MPVYSHWNSLCGSDLFYAIINILCGDHFVIDISRVVVLLIYPFMEI